MQEEKQSITRRWHGRLSASFLIVGFVLAWEGYKRYAASGGSLDWRTMLYLFAAMLSVVLGFSGLRERYRRE